MRGSSGVYVSFDRSDCGGAVTIALVSDVDRVQDSLALHQAILAPSCPQALHRQSGILFGNVRAADSYMLRDAVQALIRVPGLLSLVPDLSSLAARDPVQERGTLPRLRGQATLSALRLLLRATPFGRGALLRLVRALHADTARPQPLTRISRRARLVSRVLSGRLMTFSELSSLLTAMGEARDPAATRIAIDALSIAGCLQMFPGVLQRWIGRASCCRCGTGSEIQYVARCEKCGTRCAMCLCCSSLGLMTSCTWLFHVPPIRESIDSPGGCHQQQAVTLNIPFQLTKAQTRASRRVRRFVLGTSSGEFLVWAACGSGKTEVVCSAIATVLNRGGTVLYVVPRQSAASDIHTRLSAFFRGTSVGLLSGTRRVAFDESRFIVCTAHQTLRFRHLADLVVFDEVDAYPCTPGGFLERSVRRSRRPDGKTVYLTATPDAAMFDRIRKRLLPFCLISTRHHGRPVPVPRVLSIRETATQTRLWAGASRVSATHEGCLVDSLYGSRDWPVTQITGHAQCLCRRIGRVASPFRRLELCLLCIAAMDRSPAIVFVPTIRLVEQARRLLDDCSQDCWPGARWGFCHSRLPDCGGTLRELKEGRITSIVATTVLERGITVPGVDVVVMRADSGVFDARSLVQMAGRAGRTSDCPTGRVYFAVDETSKEVKSAIKMIQFMNDRLTQ